MNNNTLASNYELSDQEFKNLSQLVYEQVGIHLADHKKMTQAKAK